jgi:hypothetical protein
VHATPKVFHGRMALGAVSPALLHSRGVRINRCVAGSIVFVSLRGLPIGVSSYAIAMGEVCGQTLLIGLFV